MLTYRVTKFALPRKNSTNLMPDMMADTYRMHAYRSQPVCLPETGEVGKSTRSLGRLGKHQLTAMLNAIP